MGRWVMVFNDYPKYLVSLIMFDYTLITHMTEFNYTYMLQLTLQTFHVDNLCWKFIFGIMM